MNNYIYKEVTTTDKAEEDGHIQNVQLPRKMLLRQLFLCSGIWTVYFLYGVCMGAPTVFIPQIRREANSTDAVSTEMASWLNAVFGFGSVPWIFVIPILLHFYGRVLPYRLLSLTILTAIAVFYFSTNPIQILISEIMESIIGASLVTLFFIILTEYTSPQYRGVFLAMKSASYYWGIWVSNAIGTFFHWKKIAIVQLICSVYIIASAIVIPESPYWLASKGRVEDTVVAHRWLKGDNEAANEELESILNTAKEIAESKKESQSTIREFYNVVTTKEVYKPIFCCMLMPSLYYSTGKLVCTMYAIDIIKQISSSESVAYTVMLILDGITVLGMYIGCGLTKILKRKTLLTASTSVGITILLAMSIYLYLVRFSVIEENKYISAGLLILFSISISCGPMILCSSLYGELLPLKFRSTIACIVAFYDKMVMGSALKISPAIFICFGTHGAFLFFAVITSFFLIIIHKYLPETKDRTLKEISFLMSSKKTGNELKVLMKNRIGNTTEEI